jgi:tetratricopeptide (TPR) repeat protein
VTQDQPTPLEDSQTLITTSGPAEAENLAQEDAASQQSADDAEQQQLKMEQTRLAAEKRAEQDKAEQIAMLKRQQDEQARQDKLKAEQERLRNEQANKINKLLATGENQLANSQLKPAYDSFRSVRQLDPANRDAANGIQRVADTYLALATAAALNNDFDKANQHISSAISIAPTHPKLGETQTKVFELKNAQAAKPPAEATQTTVIPPPATQPEKKPRSFGGF